VLACITYKNVVVFTAEAEIMQKKRKTIDLFLPMVCISYKGDERRKILPFVKSATAIWTSLSISYGIIRMWQPFLAINAFLEGELSVPTTKVKLVQRNKVRDMVGSDYIVQSVLLDRKIGHPEVQKYLYTRFF